MGQGHVKHVISNVGAISHFSVPTGKRQLMRFLGMAGYYRKFCNNFCHSRTFDKLSWQKAKYVWTDDCRKTFDKLMTILKISPVLFAPSFDTKNLNWM